MTKNYFTDGQLNTIHKEICRLEDLESGTSLPVHPLNNVETANLRRICNLAVEAAIGDVVGYTSSFRIERILDGSDSTGLYRNKKDSNYEIPLYSVKELED